MGQVLVLAARVAVPGQKPSTDDRSQFWNIMGKGMLHTGGAEESWRSAGRNLRGGARHRAEVASIVRLKSIIIIGHAIDLRKLRALPLASLLPSPS